MTNQYRIIKNPFLDDSFKRPVEGSISDLLTDRTTGTSLDIIETPVNDRNDFLRVQSESTLDLQFAFNQGPTNYGHLVLMKSPEAIRTGKGPTYILDNAFEKSCRKTS